jgi:hypothetical protein
MIPDDSRWSFPANARFTLSESWLVRAPDDDQNPEALVRSYLSAFGPASAADLQAWSGLRGMQAVIKSMRSDLVVFRDEHKRELFDVPKAPRPSADTPAPVRFLPDFDNILLGHADRRRIITDEHRPRVVTKNLLILAAFLVDGLAAGTWKIDRQRNSVTLTLSPFERLKKPILTALSEEGERLMRFVEPEADSYSVAVTSDA